MALRRAAKKDLNHRQVVEALRAQKVLVYDLEEPVDLLCGYRGVFFTVEVKSQKGRETRSQVAWRERCESMSLPHFVHREGESLTAILDQIASLSRRSAPPQR